MRAFSFPTEHGRDQERALCLLLNNKHSARRGGRDLWSDFRKRMSVPSSMFKRPQRESHFIAFLLQ